MAYRCDKCRTQYETGAHFGGHDYCMTCYVMLRQEEEKKRRKEDALREQQERLKREKYAEQLRRESEERRRQAAAPVSSRVRSSISPYRQIAEGAAVSALRFGSVKKEKDEKKERREMAERNARAMQGKKQENVTRKLAEQRGMGEGYAIGERGLAADHGLPHVPKRREWVIRTAAEGDDRKIEHPYYGGGESAIVHAHGEEQDLKLSLKVACGLPVGLSCGQKGNMILLEGKNESVKKAGIALSFTLVDSHKKAIAAKVEPSQAWLDAGTSEKFEVKFDLPEDVPTGPLQFRAHLRETAIYVDREGGKSGEVELSSQVKTPMDLAYRSRSAKAEAGKASLAFDNRGESGGIVNSKSYLLFGSEKLPLGKDAKVKGKQKGVVLVFACGKVSADKFSIHLMGVDANGKPYEMKKVVKEKIG